MTTIEARTDERRSALTPLRVGALLALLAFTLATSAREVVQVDPFFHLAAGEWILDHGALPRQNVFLSSHPEAAFTDHEWLPQIVMALVYRSAGWSGLSLIKLATVLGFVTLVLLGPRRASPSAR